MIMTWFSNRLYLLTIFPTPSNRFFNDMARIKIYFRVKNGKGKAQATIFQSTNSTLMSVNAILCTGPGLAQTWSLQHTIKSFFSPPNFGQRHQSRCDSAITKIIVEKSQGISSKLFSSFLYINILSKVCPISKVVPSMRINFQCHQYT